MKSYLFTLFLFGFCLTGNEAAMCQFASGNYRVQYGVIGQNIYFQLMVSGIPYGMNGWTAVGFGNSMYSGLDVIAVRLLNGRVLVTDEYVRGYTRPFPDTNNVNVQSAQYTNGVLMATFSRPLNTHDYPYDTPINGCTPWKFAAGLNRMSADGSMFHHSSHYSILFQSRIMNGDETLSALDEYVAPGLRLWMLIALVSGVLLVMVVIVCCFMRIRIPRTKRQIDLIAARRKMRGKKKSTVNQNDEKSTAIVMNSMQTRNNSSGNTRKEKDEKVIRLQTILRGYIQRKCYREGILSTINEHFSTFYNAIYRNFL
ncbi:unnamed protein product, partial [Mesorhabditis belari]|uniref:DOMON domain-containing protein n=1 Tax=Mesorhabditis belari TaxID=2138241 RepID=A0AAF3JBW6_9BILA